MAQSRRIIPPDAAGAAPEGVRNGLRSRLFQALLDATTETAVLISPQGEILALNEVAADRLEIDPTAAPGLNILDLLPPEHRESRRLELEMVVREARPMRREVRRGKRLLDLKDVPVLDDSGRVEAVAVFGRDVTAQRMTEEVLRRREKIFREVVQDQTELVCRFTPGGRISFANHILARTLAPDRSDPTGEYLFSLLPVETGERVSRQLALASAESPLFALEHALNPPGGEEIWLQWHFRAIFEDGSLVECQGVGRDISERVRAEQRLEQVTREKDLYRDNLKAILESLPDGILTVDRDWNMVDANESFRRMACLERLPRPGSSMREMLVSSRCPLSGVLAQTLETGEAVLDYRTRCTAPTGGERHLALSCVPYHSPGERFDGAVLIIRDVTRLADLEEQLWQKRRMGGMIGKSRPMQEIYRLVEHLADVDSGVLVTGESGTGKELVADALHHSGVRSSGPLVKVNCAALSENLLESELFGHVRGAFTGAVRDKAGRIAAAQGGTLLLDEIGDIPVRLQLKLLRFLESHEYERVGETRTRKADVRVVAATNADLPERIRRGLFREDLYYRLRVMVLNLPPLRKRSEDIPLLTSYFADHFAKTFGKEITGVSDNVLALFMSHPWPGNVRELKHVIEHATILCPGQALRRKHLPRGVFAHPGIPRNPSEADSAALSDPTPTVSEDRPPADPSERDRILAALERTRWNKSRAARLLDMSRSTLHRRLRDLGIK